MPRLEGPEVRLERQPHRQAVQRLREAYGKLWQSRLEGMKVKMEKESKPKEREVQEV